MPYVMFRQLGKSYVLATGGALATALCLNRLTQVSFNNYDICYQLFLVKNN